jgi:hypothetical protein
LAWLAAYAIERVCYDRILPAAAKAALLRQEELSQSKAVLAVLGAAPRLVRRAGVLPRIMPPSRWWAFVDARSAILEPWGPRIFEMCLADYRDWILDLHRISQAWEQECPRDPREIVLYFLVETLIACCNLIDRQKWTGSAHRVLRSLAFSPSAAGLTAVQLPAPPRTGRGSGLPWAPGRTAAS